MLTSSISIYRLAAAVAVLTAAGAASAAPRPFDVAHAQVAFDVNSIGFGKTHGEFRSVNGRLSLDFDRPQNSRVDFTVATGSIETGSRQLDDYIRKTFLDAGDFPEMRFRSTAVREIDGSHVDVTGDLTLHGVTRPLTVRVSVDATERGQPVRFTAVGVIRRSEFGIRAATPIVADEVAIRVATQAVPGR
ncbi:YceI family protein [Chelatococcus sambhunathii]|uniref:YceI family protein n=1 Tax=Chelatococcus sambhunathii TaxID=363953 RepID=A0ABU1DFR6_9HYPH|nr:YceI family protein [Chelatococcus sambhunathii]MDR4306957.1 YceI family protein [Chelatococcus sambhunathii]